MELSKAEHFSLIVLLLVSSSKPETGVSVGDRKWLWHCLELLYPPLARGNLTCARWTRVFSCELEFVVAVKVVLVSCWKHFRSGEINVRQRKETVCIIRWNWRSNMVTPTWLYRSPRVLLNRCRLKPSLNQNEAETNRPAEKSSQWIERLDDQRFGCC